MRQLQRKCVRNQHTTSAAVSVAWREGWFGVCVMANDLEPQRGAGVCVSVFAYSLVLWTSSSHNLTCTHQAHTNWWWHVHLHAFILMVMESARSHSELIRGVIARTSLPKPVSWRGARERTCAYHKARDLRVWVCVSVRGWVFVGDWMYGNGW